MDRVRDDLEVSTELRGTVFEFTSHERTTRKSSVVPSRKDTIVEIARTDGHVGQE